MLDRGQEPPCLRFRVYRVPAGKARAPKQSPRQDGERSTSPHLATTGLTVVGSRWHPLPLQQRGVQVPLATRTMPPAASLGSPAQTLLASVQARAEDQEGLSAGTTVEAEHPLSTSIREMAGAGRAGMICVSGVSGNTIPCPNCESSLTAAFCQLLQTLQPLWSAARAHLPLLPQGPGRIYGMARTLCPRWAGEAVGQYRPVVVAPHDCAPCLPASAAAVATKREYSSSVPKHPIRRGYGHGVDSALMAVAQPTDPVVSSAWLFPLRHWEASLSPQGSGCRPICGTPRPNDALAAQPPSRALEFHLRAFGGSRQPERGKHHGCADPHPLGPTLISPEQTAMMEMSSVALSVIVARQEQTLRVEKVVKLAQIRWR